MFGFKLFCCSLVKLRNLNHYISRFSFNCVILMHPRSYCSLNQTCMYGTDVFSNYKLVRIEQQLFFFLNIRSKMWKSV